MKKLNLISLHVKNGTSKQSRKTINPAHKLYCMAKYIFKRCKHNYEFNYKPIGYEFYYDSLFGFHELRLLTFNKKTKAKDYCTMGLYISNHRSRPWITMESETGLYIKFVSHSKPRLYIPFTYDMFDLFKELVYIHYDKTHPSSVSERIKLIQKDNRTVPLDFYLKSYKRGIDLSIKELKEILYVKTLEYKEELERKNLIAIRELENHLENLKQ